MKVRRSPRGHKSPGNSAFTLIELLVVIAIIAILAVVVVLTLNPAELLRQSRDSNRLSDLATLTSAINLYNTDQAGVPTYSLGSASTTYISVPDPSATSTAGDQCQGLGMPTSTTYHCEGSSTYRSITSFGWIPINFSKITAGSPIGALPVDPTNQTSSGLYYSYATNGSTFELSALPESQKDTALEEVNPTMFTAGSNTSLLTAGGIANGSVAQTNMKLSVASNTAFVDFNAAGLLTPYIGDELVITDSSGNTLVGYIKAAGTGETYGSQLLPDPGMDTLGDFWNVNTTDTILSSGCQSGNCLRATLTAAYGFTNQSFSATNGMLLKGSTYMEKGTETSGLGFRISDPSNGLNSSGYNLPSSWTQYTLYATADTTSASFFLAFYGVTSGDTSLFDTASVTQVLTPSVTGVTIVSSSGGSSYNWTSEASGFNLNDSGGYTYSIVL